MSKGTPDTDDALRIDASTEPGDIRDFVERRTKNPHYLAEEDIWIFSYTTHEIDSDALEEIAPELDHDVYVIPYQVTGVWGYMVTILPGPLLTKPLLVYSNKDGRYKTFWNYNRLSDDRRDRGLTLELWGWLEEEWDGS